jgi:hypothetical protein
VIVLDLLEIPLPGTTWVAGRRVRSARLRPLAGWDELAVADVQEGLSSVELGLLLAERCLNGLRDRERSPVDADAVVTQLSVGDREAVLLRLRQQALGDRVALVATCSDPTCGEPMDLDVSVATMLAPSAEDARVEVTVRPGLVLRRPTGADQLAVAALALNDCDGAALALLRRCASAGDVGAEDVQPASVALDRADPQASCELTLECPACSTRLTTSLDAAELLRRELSSQRELDIAVHLLAVQYHWSEDAILSLPVARRQRYVEILGDAIGVSQGALG